MVQVGSKVRCIDNDGCEDSLTLGEIYTVTVISGHAYRISKDIHNSIWWDNKRFEEVEMEDTEYTKYCGKGVFLQEGRYFPALIEEDKKEIGVKADSGKIQYSLITTEFLRELAIVLTKGAIKYGPDNWMYVDDAKKRYTDAIFRHEEAWRSGEECDPEFGTHHMAHIAANAMMLQWHDTHKKEINNEIPI